ncbi:MAG: NAD(P)H-dependent oxidoreductase subunit E [Deltaproteobacteria bacterium]|nr:MAG: NAD(P)H-dependent oxidoreductase subunit E [Deltaproteobacteria bacterium]
MNTDDVVEIVERKKQGLGGIMSILGEIQATYGFLSRETLETVSRITGVHLVDVYGVATFYASFRLTPRGKHLVSVCLGTACHVRGGQKGAEEFERKLGIRAMNTTADNEFTLETVNCLGACALGPVVVVDGHYFPNRSPSRVGEVLAKAKEGLDRIEVLSDERVLPAKVVDFAPCKHSLMDGDHPVDGHPSIRALTSSNSKRG